MTALPLFSLSARVTAEEGKQDGISLELGDWFVQGIGNSVGAFVDLLGPRPTEGNEEDGYNASSWANILTTFRVSTLEAEFFGWMFNRPAGNFDAHTEMDLSAGGSGSAPRPGAPLAKGKLQFVKCKPEGDVSEDTRRRQLRLKLFLNPTRYIRHQEIPSCAAEAPSSWCLGPANLHTTSLPRRRRVGNELPEAEPETSLDGNDNVLISTEALNFARPEAWPIHMRRYFYAVEDTLDSEFRRAATSADLRTPDDDVADLRTITPQRILKNPYYVLKKVETYFEFYAPNPTQLLRRLEPALESMGTANRSRSYPLGLSEGGTHQTNARSLMITLPGGRLLRVYAKTTHRIRFEIIHDTAKASVWRLLHAEGGGFTTGNREELLGWFRLLSVDAADQLNNVLAQLQSRVEIPPDSADVYEFYSEIFGAVRNAQRAKDLVKLLIENGCLHVGRRGTDFLPEIKQLRRIGFLQQSLGADFVTPRFRQALDRLRAQSGLEPLTPPFNANSPEMPLITARERTRRVQ